MNSVIIETKIKKLEEELAKYKEKHTHLTKEYAATKSGSAYGVEYFDIQIRVYESMIIETKREIERLKTGLKVNCKI